MSYGFIILMIDTHSGTWFTAVLIENDFVHPWQWVLKEYIFISPGNAPTMLWLATASAFTHGWLYRRNLIILPCPKFYTKLVYHDNLLNELSDLVIKTSVDLIVRHVVAGCIKGLLYQLIFYKYNSVRHGDIDF